MSMPRTAARVRNAVAPAALAALVAALPGLAHAADKAPTLSPQEADALACFARQAATAPRPTGAALAPIGAYLWSGRADETYRPFFEWDLRLQGGSAPIQQLRARIATLSPTRTILVQGDWAEWTAIAPGGTAEVRYRAHCPTFCAYQLEAAWSGGSETFVACDKGAVPVPLSSLKDQGFAVAVNLNDEVPTGATSGVFTWTDWNLGGKPARAVVHTIHLRDQNLKEIKAIAITLAGDLAPGAVSSQQAKLSRLPAFATCSISVDQAGEDLSSESQGFTGAKDIEVAELRPAGGKLQAKVRNGLPNAVDGIVVTITLQDAGGKSLGSVDIPVGHLDSGAVMPISAPLEAASFAGYETSWKSASPSPASGPAAPGAATASGLPGAVEADHLRFAATALSHGAVGWLLAGTLTNTAQGELGPLTVRLRVSDRAHQQEEVSASLSALAAGASAPVAFALSAGEVAAVQMTWTASTP
jgi:hypothetical protein